MSVQLIWRKSIHDNGYRCTKCGNRLVDKDGYPSGTSIENIDKPKKLYCQKCGYDVGEVAHVNDKVMEYMGINESPGKVNHIGDFDDFCGEVEKKLDKLKIKETALNEQLKDCRNLKNENEELKQKIKALQERNKTLEDRITKENDKHYKELKKQDAEINRLYKIIENINKG